MTQRASGIIINTKSFRNHFNRANICWFNAIHNMSEDKRYLISLKLCLCEQHKSLYPFSQGIHFQTKEWSKCKGKNQNCCSASTISTTFSLLNNKLVLQTSLRKCFFTVRKTNICLKLVSREMSPKLVVYQDFKWSQCRGPFSRELLATLVSNVYQDFRTTMWGSVFKRVACHNGF